MILELDQPKPSIVVHLASPIEGLAICGRPLVVREGGAVFVVMPLR